jgi:hypothetical protein
MTADRARPLLAAARAAAERGWPVFPLRPYGKRPAIKDWPNRATCDPGQVARWWARVPWNVGIACGPAHLLVIDLDRAEGGAGEGAEDGRVAFAGLAAAGGAEFESTFTVATPSGGEHRYYAVPDGPLPLWARSTVGTLGRHVDTRGAGGYVVAAGSVRRVSGRRVLYRAVDATPPTVTPDWLVALLTPPARPVTSVTVLGDQGRSAYAQAALSRESHRVRSAELGGRNAALFEAGLRMGSLISAGLLDEWNVRAELLSAATVHFGVDRFTAAEAEQAIGNGLRYGKRRPRQVRAG